MAAFPPQFPHPILTPDTPARAGMLGGMVQAGIMVVGAAACAAIAVLGSRNALWLPAGVLILAAAANLLFA